MFPCFLRVAFQQESPCVGGDRGRGVFDHHGAGGGIHANRIDATYRLQRLFDTVRVQATEIADQRGSDAQADASAHMVHGLNVATECEQGVQVRRCHALCLSGTAARLLAKCCRAFPHAGLCTGEWVWRVPLTHGLGEWGVPTVIAMAVDRSGAWTAASDAPPRRDGGSRSLLVTEFRVLELRMSSYLAWPLGAAKAGWL